MKLALISLSLITKLFKTTGVSYVPSQWYVPPLESITKIELKHSEEASQ